MHALPSSINLSLLVMLSMVTKFSFVLGLHLTWLVLYDLCFHYNRGLNLFLRLLKKSTLLLIF